MNRHPDGITLEQLFEIEAANRLATSSRTGLGRAPHLGMLPAQQRTEPEQPLPVERRIDQQPTADGRVRVTVLERSLNANDRRATRYYPTSSAADASLEVLMLEGWFAWLETGRLA